MALKSYRFRQDSLLPGTGRHWNDPTWGSDYHRVTLRVDSLNEHGHAHSVPVHVLAQGRSEAGALVFDRDTGAPYTVYDEIWTPDILFYDLDEGVAGLDVQGIRLGDPGEKLLFDVQVDGQHYPSGQSQSWSQPTPAVGGMRGVLAHVLIDVVGFFRGRLTF